MVESLKGDPAELAQQLLDEAVNEAKASQTRFERWSSGRYYVAVALKAIALFGGLAVATLDVDKRVLGTVISAAVILDQLFSNHKRMMTEAIAANAISRTIRKVQNNYNDQVVDVVQTNRDGDARRAYTLLTALARVSAKTVRDELERINAAVAAANIQFLSTLNLDQPSNTALPHTPDPARVHELPAPTPKDVVMRAQPNDTPGKGKGKKK